MNRPRREMGPGPQGRDGVHTLRAVVLIVVLIVVGAAVLARTTTSKQAGRATTTTHSQAKTTPTTAGNVPAPTTTTTVLPPSQVKVQVLNGVLTGALAGQWSTKLKANPGYQTLPPDDATSKVAASVIYIVTPGYQAEANALAAAVGLPSSAVNQTVPPPATAPIPPTERGTANLILIIGPDLAGSA